GWGRHSGGDGDDLSSGGPGTDEIDAGDGNDVVASGPRSDVVDLGDGDDVLYGGTGAAESIDCGEGVDTVYSKYLPSRVGYGTVANTVFASETISQRMQNCEIVVNGDPTGGGYAPRRDVTAGWTNAGLRTGGLAAARSGSRADVPAVGDVDDHLTGVYDRNLMSVGSGIDRIRVRRRRARHRRLRPRARRRDRRPPRQRAPQLRARHPRLSLAATRGRPAPTP